MKKAIISAVSVLLAGVVSAAAVMKVNGVEVSQAQVDVAKKVIGLQMPQGAGDEQVMLRHAVDQTIFRLLFLQAAREAKVEVDLKAVDEAIAKQKAAMGGAKFEEGLKAAGLTEADIRRLEEERAVMEKFVETAIKPGVTVAEAETKSYYDTHLTEFARPEAVKLRMLVVAAPQGTDEAAKAAKTAASAKAEVAWQRIKAGEDFVKVVGEVSEDDSKANGGDIGFVPKGRFTPDFEAAIFAVKVGETTPVLENQHGFYIFKVEEHSTSSTAGFPEVKDALTKRMQTQKIGIAVRQRITTMKDKAVIEFLDPGLKAAMAAPAAAAPGEKPVASPAPALAQPVKSH